jgi:hypothetical protein
MGFADAYLRKAGLREPLIESEPHPGLQVIVTIPAYKESGLERCLDSLFSCAFISVGRGEPDLTVNREGTGHSGSHQIPGTGHNGSRELPTTSHKGCREIPGTGPIGNREITSTGPSDNTPAPVQAEAIILINAPAHAPAEVLEANLRIHERARKWIEDHPHPYIEFHLLLDHSFNRKEAGVGMARKILMDEAARRFDRISRPRGIIASMDADAVVEDNYLLALVNHFRTQRVDGCSIYFEHPIAGGEFSPAVYSAITQYELHLRYYLQSIRSTGYPYAFHTVGSSMAVVAGIYCREGGMNRRQAGEDFYFIQKIAQLGSYSECNDTCVMPSPRPSDRVPFGTGAAVVQQLQSDDGLLTYAPELFRMLAIFFKGMEFFCSGVCLDHFLKSRPAILLEFLDRQNFGEAVVEIRHNSASPESFKKRFWRWFNVFRIMKFLHFARENGYPDIPVGQAARELLVSGVGVKPGLGSVREETAGEPLSSGAGVKPGLGSVREETTGEPLSSGVGVKPGLGSSPEDPEDTHIRDLSLERLLKIYRRIDRGLC